MGTTGKHSIRIPDITWSGAIDRAEEIARLGISGEHGPYAVADMVRHGLDLCQAETLQESLNRLGLTDKAQA